MIKNPNKQNKTPPSTRENSYLVPPKDPQVAKPRIFAPFVPSHKSNNLQTLDNQALNPDFLLNLQSTKPIKRKPIIDMTIDIGGNIERKILIFEGDESSSLARQFCIDNRLDLQCCELITQELERQISGYYEKKALEIKKKPEKATNSQRQKHKSLHSFDKKDHKLKKNLSVKSFKEDISQRNLSSSSEGSRDNLVDNKDIKIRSSDNKIKNDKILKNHKNSKNGGICLNIPSNKNNAGSGLIRNNNIASARYNKTDISRNKGKNEVSEVITNHMLNKNEKLNKFNQLTELPKKKDEECTFKPKINGPKSPFYDDSNGGGKRYEQLYDKHKERQKKHSRVMEEFIEETCSFQPEINKSSKTPNNINNKEELIDKLYNTQKVWDRNREERAKIERNYDLKTGQKLFNPVIKKDKYYEKAKLKELNEGQIKVVSPRNDIQQNQIIAEAKKPIKSFIANKNEIKVRKTAKSLGKSGSERQIDKNVKEKEKIQIFKGNQKDLHLLKELFNSLDSNKDGKISRNQIDFSELDTDLLEIIAGLALDVFGAKEVIELEDFVRILEEQNLMKSILKVKLFIYYDFC